MQISVKPNGTMTTSLAFLFVDYFAARSGRLDEWKKLNAFVNEKYMDILSSPDVPNAYMIYLARPETQGMETKEIQ